MELVNIVIWGIGKKARIVVESLKYDKCKLIACVDRDESKNILIDGKKYSAKRIGCINSLSYDYIIVTAVDIKEIKEDIKNNNIKEDKVIYFWKEDISNYQFLSEYPKKFCLLEKRLEEYELEIKNAPYEYGTYKGPIILSAVELLKRIIKEKKSLCRFGDGEFEIMLGRDRSKFQKANREFTKKLISVLENNNSNIIVAIADNYGSLSKYTEKAANSIRAYLTEDVRKEHMKLLDKNRVYYDAYVSRSYMMYKDKNYSKKIFELYKKLFMKRNLLIVEGEYTRSGYGNDLFSTAGSIRRILCPDYNCYDVYDKIYRAVIDNAQLDDLILITLGSAATILAYDLAENGYQAIDLGQLDNEYEWSLRKSETIEPIEGKTVSDAIFDKHFVNINKDERYESEIILKIEGV